MAVPNKIVSDLGVSIDRLKLAGSGPMPKDVDHEARHQTIVREKTHQCDSDSPVGILMGPGRRRVRFPAVVRDALGVYDYRTACGYPRRHTVNTADGIEPA